MKIEENSHLVAESSFSLVSRSYSRVFTFLIVKTGSRPIGKSVSKTDDEKSMRNEKNLKNDRRLGHSLNEREKVYLIFFFFSHQFSFLTFEVSDIGLISRSVNLSFSLERSSSPPIRYFFSHFLVD